MSIRKAGVIIAGTGGGGSNPDDVTINKNNADKLQAIGTINKNTTGTISQLYNWMGTLAEYTEQNIETLHPEWVCFITDDADGSSQLNNPFSLLDYKYSEYELNNASWLLSNGQFNSGAVYQSVYDLLLQELNGTSSKLPYRSYVNTIGSLVNADGILSGFSASSYAELPKIFDTGDNPWEVVFKVKTGTSLSNNENIIGDGIGAPYSGLYIIIYNGKWGLGISSNGSSWDIAEASRNVGQISVVADTNYYLKASWDGSQYKLDVSADGLSYQNSVTVNSTTKKVAKLQSIGCSAVNAGYQFNGTINLNESYININGERWWTGRRKIITTTGDYTDEDYRLNTSDTTFRLPIKVLMAGSKKVAGNGMTLGLTDGTNNFSINTSSNSQYSPQTMNSYGQLVGTSSSGSYYTQTDTLSIGVTTDEIKSGIETSANGLYLYFYVGETVQDANIIAAGQALTDIADLKNASNFSQTGLSTLSGLGMPSDRYIDLTIGASGATYTAPANGYFCAASSNSWVILAYDKDYSFANDCPAISGVSGGRALIPVKKGDIVNLAYGSIQRFRFYYAEGEENV